MSLGERLKEERERLGFSQEAFAGLVAASRKSQMRWEQDDSFPDAAQLASWIPHGLDALYVLTGIRPGDAPPLNKDEADFVALYRAAPLAVRAAAIAALTAGTTASTPKYSLAFNGGVGQVVHGDSHGDMHIGGKKPRKK